MRFTTGIVLSFLVPAIAFSQVSITGSTPAEGAVNVPTSTTVSLTFSAPIDTTAPFNQENSFVTNFDNITGQSWSTDRMTVNLFVELQPNTVYFIGVYGAHPAGGGSLSVPFGVHFTTGSSFPSNVYSVSGTVSAGATGYSPSYAIVAMTVSGLAGSGGPDFVAVSAADVNGDFTIPYVPEGTWVPIAAKDINGDGSIDPSQGDAVAQSDAVVVNGGNVSGVSIVFQVFPSPYFGDARDSVLAFAASNLPGNRQLRRVDGYDLDSVGAANSWEFYYTVPGDPSVTRVRVEQFGLSSDNRTGDWDYVYYSKPIPDVSTAAIADSFISQVENTGGRDFRHQAPAGDTVIFRSQVSLGDLNWSQYSWMVPDTNQFYWGAQYSYERVVNFDSSYSIMWRLFLGEFATGNVIAVTSVEHSPTAPAAFALRQNYPNPFNPTTTIAYELPERANVSLRVFNLLGQQVAVLVNGVEAPGVHEAHFEASRLSSGVYFYRLEASTLDGGRARNFVAVKKLLLVR